MYTRAVQLINSRRLWRKKITVYIYFTHQINCLKNESFLRSGYELAIKFYETIRQLFYLMTIRICIWLKWNSNLYKLWNNHNLKTFEICSISKFLFNYVVPLHFLKPITIRFFYIIVLVSYSIINKF